MSYGARDCKRATDWYWPFEVIQRAQKYRTRCSSRDWTSLHGTQPSWRVSELETSCVRRILSNRWVISAIKMVCGAEAVRCKFWGVFHLISSNKTKEQKWSCLHLTVRHCYMPLCSPKENNFFFAFYLGKPAVPAFLETWCTDFRLFPIHVCRLDNRFYQAL